MDEPFGPADEELLVDHHDNGGENHLQEAHGHMVALQEGWYRPAPHVGSHREVHQHQQKADRPEKAFAEGRGLVVFQGRLLAGVACLSGLPLQAGTVSGILYGLDDVLAFGGAFDRHRVGQQADRAGGDPCDALDCLLDVRAARSTTHACDLIVFHFLCLISSVVARFPPARR